MKVSQAQREQAKTESDSAFERLRADMERYNAEQGAKMEKYNAEQSAKITEQNTKMAEQAKDMVKFIATMAVGIVVVLGGFIAVLQFFE